MDPRIENLKSTTFFGKRLRRRQIADIQTTVSLFPGLSRRELGSTICEHLGWFTPNGGYRVQSCLRMLEQLEELGILRLPAKRESMRRGPQKPPAGQECGAPEAAIACGLQELAPLSLRLATCGIAMKIDPLVGVIRVHRGDHRIDGAALERMHGRGPGAVDVAKLRIARREIEHAPVLETERDPAVAHRRNLAVWLLMIPSLAPLRIQEIRPFLQCSIISAWQTSYRRFSPRTCLASK